MMGNWRKNLEGFLLGREVLGHLGRERLLVLMLFVKRLLLDPGRRRSQH